MIDISPPVAMRFEQIKPYQVSNARRGICPHCVTATLNSKHRAGELNFLQCATCSVVVVVEAI